MIPVIGSKLWFFMPLPPTPKGPAMLAKVYIVNGEILSATARERHYDRRHHWAAGVGYWTVPE